MHDLTVARKNARTEEDAAAIAWAQDRIEELEADRNDLIAQVKDAGDEIEQLKTPPPMPPPSSGIVGISDPEAYFNMRGWLQRACEAAGARIDGAGIGGGQADIDIVLEGHRYNVSIRPLTN